MTSAHAMLAGRPDRFKIPAALWDGIQGLGLSPAAVVAESGLAVALLSDQRILVSTTEYFAIWNAIRSLGGGPAAGLALAREIPPARLPPAMVAAYHARDFGDALTRMARYKKLCSPEEMAVTIGGNECVVVLTWLYAKRQQEPAALIDAAFASIVELGRRGTNVEIRPRRVELIRRAEPTARHAAYFGCSIRTGARRNALVLDARDLERPFPAYNEELLELLREPLEKSHQRHRAHGSILQHVKLIMKRLLVGESPSVVAVARELGLSERTLQRRIMESGSSFRALFLETRHQLAREYLTQQSMPIAEVAYLLGYEDLNSFYRAFRKWEGTTPAQWRADQVTMTRSRRSRR